VHAARVVAGARRRVAVGARQCGVVGSSASMSTFCMKPCSSSVSSVATSATGIVG